MANLTKRLAFRCTDELYENVKEMADDKGQTVTDLITFLLIDELGNYYNEKGCEK